MISRIKRITVVIASVLVISNTILGATVTGIKSINNSTKDSDYKVDDKSLKRIGDKLNNTSDFKEYFEYTQDKDSSGVEKEIAYLIENNIVTREGEITVEKDSVEFKKGKLDLEYKIPLSEFLMGLYKSKWGVIESNPLLIKTKAIRNINGKDISVVESDEYKPIGYSGNDTTFNFDGDFHAYISPNVSELYIAELLNKGIVSRASLEGTNYLRAFDSIGTNPKPWAKDGSLVVAPKSGETVLGSSWTVSSDNKKTVYSKRNSQIFTTETVTKIEALRYVSEVLRLTEHDMTETEARIVSYKYGVNYTSNLPSEDKKVVEYLIAMGILNFENPSDIGDLYDPLNYADAFDIFYRVNNKAGRFEFSKIQLTDSDNFWIQQGYGESELRVVNLKKDFTDVLHTEIEEVTSVSQLDSTRFRLVSIIQDEEKRFKNVDNKTETSSTKKTWKVVRYFPENSQYTYRGMDIEDLSDTVADVVKNTHNRNLGRYEVEFTVQAVDETTAIMVVDSHTSYKANVSLSENKFSTVTKVNTEDGANTTLIPADSLNQLSSDIQIIEDKVLMNKVSGAMAILLPEKGYALVGTKVITSKDLIVFSNSNEIYYNLDVIASLMTNAFMSSIDDQCLYLTKLEDGSLFKDNYFVDVLSSNDTKIDVTNIATISGVPGASGSTQKLDYYNISLMQRGINTIYKDIGDCTVVIDWSYIVPKENAGNFHDYNYNPKIKEMTSFFYTKPQGALADWWDSNLTLSNALANWMYGTTGINYIQSGYLAPSVNILAPSNEIGEKLKTDMLKSLGLSSSYLTKFTGSSDVNKLIGTEFNATTGNGGSLHDSLKAARKFNINTQVAVPADQLGNGECYTNFLKLANGSLYRSISSDGRVLRENSMFKDKLYVKTRVQDTRGPMLGRTVKFKGQEFLIKSIGGGTDDNNDAYPKNMYYALMSTTPLSGNITPVGNDKYLLKDNAIKNKANELISLTQDMPNGAVWITDDEMNLHQNTQGANNARNGYYLINGEIYFLQTGFGSSAKYVKVSKDEIQREIIDKNAVVYTYPLLWVNINSVIYNTDTGELETTLNIPFLSSSNLLYSSLNRAVIDSIIAKSVDVKSVNELESGDSLIIGDLEYIKDGSTFRSLPATDRSVIDSLKAGENSEISSAKMFTGIVLDYSGRPVPLIDFVESVDVDTLPKDVKGENTIIKTNGQLMITNGNSLYLLGEKVANSVTVSASFNNNVLCRTIGDGKYVLVQSTSKLSDGYLSNAPFFGESLNFDVTDDLLSGLEKGRFSPVGNYIDKMKEFTKQLQDWRRQDIQTVLRNILVILSWWFVIISWICYCVLRFGLGNIFFEIFRNPSRGSTRSGIDVIKIASLGAYNLDMEYSPSNPNSIKFINIVTGSVIAMIIQYVLITFF